MGVVDVSPATHDGTVPVRCQCCDSVLGSVTVMGPDEPLGPVHVALVVDCVVRLRPAMALIRYQVVASSTPSTVRRRRRGRPGPHHP